MKVLYLENIKCIIGQNAEENWKILDDTKPNNLLFHLTSFPSCYVILESENDPSIDIIKNAAALCKQNTKYKNIPILKVDYTKCENILKGDKIGEIFFKSNRKVNKIIV